MKVTRKTLKQSGAALEQAVRRDMNGCMAVAMDKAVFLGAGATGSRAGILVGQLRHHSTGVNAAASWSAFRAAVTRFMTANAAGGPGAVRLLIRPEVFDAWTITLLTQHGRQRMGRLVKNIPTRQHRHVFQCAGGADRHACGVKALLTVTAGGVAPVFVGTWGAIDLIRDPYQRRGERRPAAHRPATMDVTVSRPAQLEILTGVQTEVDSG